MTSGLSFYTIFLSGHKNAQFIVTASPSALTPQTHLSLCLISSYLERSLVRAICHFAPAAMSCGGYQDLEMECCGFESRTGEGQFLLSNLPVPIKRFKGDTSFYSI